MARPTITVSCSTLTAESCSRASSASQALAGRPTVLDIFSELRTAPNIARTQAITLCDLQKVDSPTVSGVSRRLGPDPAVQLWQPKTAFIINRAMVASRSGG